MKDFWITKYVELREQVKKSDQVIWDDDDYWRRLENKIMAAVAETEMRPQWSVASKPKLVAVKEVHGERKN